MKESKKLTDYQANVLGAIVQGSIRTISYRNPRKELGSIAENPDAVSDALRHLENDGVLALKPRKRFFVDVSEYEVNLEKAAELWDSYHYQQKR